jgi:hypothetical protein
VLFALVADLVNLQVDLLFFDTTSTCFQTGEKLRSGSAEADAALSRPGRPPTYASRKSASARTNGS